MSSAPVSCSYAWRGFRGVGKRTQLLAFLKKQADAHHLPFELTEKTWYLNKPSSTASAAAQEDDDDDGEIGGKSIPYEESILHLGFDCARMSMSDKIFLQSILTRWTGKQDVCLISSSIYTRYLVLYHAHYLADESVLQLQECLEQFPSFAILLTTELPLCERLRDFCLELPVAGEDHLLASYTHRAQLQPVDAWLQFFANTLNEWSKPWVNSRVVDIRTWIYTCLQRNLRWTDVIMNWIQTIYATPWIRSHDRKPLLDLLWQAESGSGWVLLTSYRIPILWEHVHLKLARRLSQLKNRAELSLSSGDSTSNVEHVGVVPQ